MKSARANGGPRLTYHEILKKKYDVLHSCREIVFYHTSTRISSKTTVIMIPRHLHCCRSLSKTGGKMQDIKQSTNVDAVEGTRC